MAHEAPIFGFNSKRDAIVGDVVDRVVSATRDPIYTLNDAAYWETKRLETSKKKSDKEKLSEWQRLARNLTRMTEHERKDRLRELASDYGWDIAGNFDPRVYKLSTRILPPLVTALLAPHKLLSLARHPSELLDVDALSEKVVVEGPTAELRGLAEKGVMVYVPTHQSNMDSIVFGYALERAGLPPATYGAGKNLFTNPVLSFFMHNLGAYRVDRRLRHTLYKDVLKTYSAVLLERGYHSLFFPGGTRSRSGGIERKLKLGLMGSAVEAYARTLAAGRERRVYFVPSTINYLITLEAETLIADFLSEAGKARFIIEDDESTRLSRMAGFMRKLLGMDSSVVVRFGKPIDPFGNKVEADGESYDRRGRRVDPASYVKNTSGDVVLDASRDAQYTRELGEEICRQYEQQAVILSTHVVASACFDALRRAAGRDDLFTILRPRDTLVIPRDELASDVRRRKEELALMEQRGEVALGEFVRSHSGGDLVERALRAFAGYHSNPVLEARKDGIAIRDPKLLFYYQNRLASHGLAFDTLGPRAPGAIARGGAGGSVGSASGGASAGSRESEG